MECLIQCINHAVEDAAIIGEMERLLMEENRLIETNFQCGECGNIFLSEKDINTHISNAHKENYECLMCQTYYDEEHK